MPILFNVRVDRESVLDLSVEPVWASTSGTFPAEKCASIFTVEEEETLVSLRPSISIVMALSTTDRPRNVGGNDVH